MFGKRHGIFFHDTLFSLTHQNQDLLCRPRRVGSSYCLTDVRVSVRITSITKGTPAQNFFGRHVFCFLGLLIFAMTLTFASCESVFHRKLFFSYSVKSTRGILIKRVRKLHGQVAHDLIIVDLQLTYFCIKCVVLKLPIL